MGYKGDKSAAHPPEGSLVETRYLKASSLPLFLLQSHAPDRSPERAPPARLPGHRRKAALQTRLTKLLLCRHRCKFISFYLHKTARDWLISTQLILGWIYLNPEFFFLSQPMLQGQSNLLYTLSRRKNCWIQTFPKGFRASWNANSLIMELNSGHRINFQRRHELH